MKYLEKTDFFEHFQGHCWAYSDTFQAYGSGFPEKVEFYNISDHLLPARFYLRYISHCTAHSRYYQRRSRQTAFLSVIIVEKGKLYCRSNQNILLAEAGDCIFLKPHCQNDFICMASDTDATAFFEVILTGTALNEMLQLYGLDRKLWCQIKDFSFFYSLLKRTGKLAKAPDAVNRLPSLSGLSLETLQFLTEHCRNQKIDEKLQAVHDYLATRIHEKIRIADLAHSHNICLPVLNRRFRECFGTTPYNYLKQLRLQKGAQLLREGISLKELIPQVGYESVKAFSAEFQRFFSVSPQKFRRQS